MNINIEEMKAAVLAECERICPNRGDRHELNGVLLLLENFGSGWLFCMSFPEGTEIDLVSVARYTQDWSFVWAYRLLGLEAKAKDDEVANLRAEVDQLKFELGEYANWPHASNGSMGDQHELSRKWGLVITELNRLVEGITPETGQTYSVSNLVDIGGIYGMYHHIKGYFAFVPKIGHVGSLSFNKGCPYNHDPNGAGVTMFLYNALQLEQKAKDAEIERLKNENAEILRQWSDTQNNLLSYRLAKQENDRLRELGESYISMLEAELEYPEDEEAKFNLEILLNDAREALKGGQNG